MRLTLVASANVGFTPITDLGTGFYQGRQGGLYPGGANVRPHTDNAGLVLAGSIQLVGAAPQTTALADRVRAVTLASRGAHLKNDCRSPVSTAMNSRGQATMPFD